MTNEEAKELIDKQTCLDAFDETAEILLNNGYISLGVKILKTQYEILRDFYDEQIDAKPVVRGEWKDADNRTEYKVVRCSNCGKGYGKAIALADYHFCPNCGADMRGEKECLNRSPLRG